MKIVIAVVICLFALCQAHPGGRGPGGRGPGGRGAGGRGSGERGPGSRGQGRPLVGPGGEAISRWNRTVGEETFQESGWANSTNNVVVVRSRRGATLYDFSGATVLVVARVGPKCFIIDGEASLTTFQAAADAVNNRNGTTIGAPSGTLQLNATEGTESTATSDALSKFCRNQAPIETVPAGADFPVPGTTDPEPGQWVLSFNTIDTNVQILVSRPQGRGGRGRGHRG